MTKAMLLPISTVRARDLSLENHLALVALEVGCGNIELIGRLLKALYISYFIHETVHGRRDLALFRTAENLLHRNAVGAKIEASLSLAEPDVLVLAQILTLFDRQLASMPAHSFAQAHDRLNRFLVTDAPSPIAVDDATNV